MEGRWKPAGSREGLTRPGPCPSPGPGSLYSAAASVYRPKPITTTLTVQTTPL